MGKVISSAGTGVLAFIIIVFGSWVIVAQKGVTGEWTASTLERSPDKVQLNFITKNERGNKNQNGSGYLYSDLQGLSREQVKGGSVGFSLIREAGTIECTGAFSNGNGSGTFRFLPNQGFVDGMRNRGFDFEKASLDKSSTTEERLFTAAMVNVTTALADDLKSANFPNLDVGDLFKAAIFKIDGKFMAEMAATGFPNLTMEDLVKARIFKIDANFVRSIKDMGFGAENFEHLVKYSIFKVTPEYLTELRNEGLADLDVEDVVKLRIFKVDAAFIRQARADDPNITIEKIVQKKIGIWAR